MYYFVDFKELKIKKQYNFKTINGSLIFLEDESLVLLEKKIDNLLDQMLSQLDGDNPTLFMFNIDAPEENDVDNLITLSNLIVPACLKKLETGKGYKRERRLGAPDNLKALNTKYGIIKRACNADMKVHSLNIQINLNELTYFFCDGKNVEVANNE